MSSGRRRTGSRRRSVICRRTASRRCGLRIRVEKKISMADARPIIIIKKKGGHGGHHGGAWKVAYADFVTAMMALFIVLWLLNTSKPVREAIAGYFKDPSGTANKMGSTKAGHGRGSRHYQRRHAETEAKNWRRPSAKSRTLTNSKARSK